jgi:hypothetical protein
MTRTVSRIGIAAALTLGMVATAAAQTKPKATPTKTVPVSKEVGGEVTKVDTVRVTVHDTVTNTVYSRPDTIRLTGPTVTHYDTTTIMTTPGYLDLGSGLYFGLGAGAEYPSAGLGGGQIPGYAIRANLGVDPAGSPLGLRLTGEWARPDESQVTGAFTARPSIINTTADLKLRLPFLRSARFPFISLYAVGGAALGMYKDIVMEDENKSLVMPDGKFHDAFGWNAGGGFAVSLGHKRQLFTEARFMSTMKSGFENNHQIPVVLGINWY